MDQKILTLFQQNILKTPPLWFMRQAGRILPEYREVRSRFSDFMAFCLDSQAICEVTLQPVKRFQTDAAILFSDILLLPFVCGQNVVFKEKEGPVLSPLHIPTFLDQEFETLEQRLSPVFEAIEKINSKISSDVAFIGFAGAPWTVALYMLENGASKDFHKAKIQAFKDPLLFQKIIDHLTLLTAHYLERQIKAGVHLLQIFESWAGLVPAPFFEAWVLKPMQVIRSFLKERYPDVPLIAFPKGLGVSALSTYQRVTQVEGLSVDFATPLEQLSSFPCVIQGNLDPSILVSGGKTLETQTTFILKTMQEKPFIFNLGHGMLPGTPLEHVNQLIYFIRNWEM